MAGRYIELRFRGGKWESTTHSGITPANPTWSTLPGVSQLDIKNYIRRTSQGDNRVLLGGVSASEGRNLDAIYAEVDNALATARYDIPISPALARPSAPSPVTAAPTGPTGAPGQVPTLNPDDFYVMWDDIAGGYKPVPAGTPGAVFDDAAWAAANQARHDVATGFDGGTGRTGPTAAELAIQQAAVDAQNLGTFISGTVAELEAELDAKRLSTDQAIAEFNRRLDAFSEGGRQFQGIQPYTIPIGAEYAPGFQPGGVAESLGIAPRPAEVIQYDPFGMAADIVAETPVITDIGAPTGNALDEAIELARGFLGG